MIKNGDKAITAQVRRTPKGLEVSVQLHPIVEEFMRMAGTDEITPVKLFGRRWQSNEDLQIYDIPDAMKGMFLSSMTTAYRMDKPGDQLVLTDPASQMKTINMSFLRLVGASKPEGITFVVGGVWPEHEAVWVASNILEAGNVIYKQYIRPMVISISSVVVDNGLQQTPDQPRF